MTMADNDANKMYWRGKPLEDYDKAGLIDIIRSLQRSQEQTRETLEQMSDLMTFRIKA